MTFSGSLPRASLSRICSLQPKQPLSEFETGLNAKGFGSVWREEKEVVYNN